MFPNRSLKLAFVLFFVLSAAIPELSRGQGNWPRFRGRDGRSVAEDNPALPESWSQEENVDWAADIPGWGWASPIVWGDRVFISTVVSEDDDREPSKGLYLGQGVREPSKGIHRWMVMCFDLVSGNELWRRESHVGEPAVPRHPKSTYAAETPVTDGERLYVLFGDLGLYCYSFEGDLLWKRAITPQKTFFDYGAAASPVVHDGQVIVVYDNLEDSWITSFDAKSGEERWKKSRDEKRSWATPLVWENEQRTEIVVPGLRRNRSYSLDGELLWEFDGQMSGLVIPSPFPAHGMVYIASGYVGDSHRPTFAIKPGATGEIATEGDFTDSPFIEWYQPTASPYNTSQIVHGDYLYTVYDQGFITCHDAKSGEEVYGKRRFPKGASFTSSPWAYNDKIFCLSEDGDTYVVKAGDEYELLATNSLDELCFACPAVVNDRLLIRTASKLYCLRNQAGPVQTDPKQPNPDPSNPEASIPARGDEQELQDDRGATTETDADGTHGYADSGGVKIHYVTRGEGPLLVMLHGFPDYWYTWRKQMPGLSEHFKVVAIDLRGYNRSDQPEGVEQYVMPKLVGDVKAVVEHFGESKAVVVGHDWGGMIAWSFAMRHPEMTDRLVVLNLPHPAGLSRELANNPKQQKASAYARDFQKPDAASKLTAEGLTFWVSDQEAKSKYVEAFRRSSFEAMLNYYKANYPRPPYKAQTEFPKVRCSVLLLHGLKDTALLATGLNDNWSFVEKDLTLVTIPGASHFVQQDAAEFVTRQMVNWLTRDE